MSESTTTTTAEITSNEDISADISADIFKHLDLETLLVQNVKQMTDPREVAQMAKISRILKHCVNKKIKHLGTQLKHQCLKRFPILKRLQYSKNLKIKIVGDEETYGTTIMQLKMEIQDAKVVFRHKLKGRPLSFICHFSEPEKLYYQEREKQKYFSINEIQEVK